MSDEQICDAKRNLNTSMQVLCLQACWVEDPHSEAFKRHLARLPAYFWVAEDGLKSQVNL